ncbi:rRNA methyltransferase 2, mitochondrial [Halyomorpha halys]|uniref:rRNA methyltransferase 2, mitochondrial n=1 Tax=Halyomorpha halys TaxID=286706 RepID=UPI0006D4D050|nr:rRNA methyltransferase 2, mitochondrial [Halyomorpha halys]
MFNKPPLRLFYTCLKLDKKIPINLKGKSKSSQDWLIRQLKDPYVENAKIKNYRSRSAFKLLEIDEKHKILCPGQCVVDCGAAPGGWTQVAVDKANAALTDKHAKQGFVVGIDLLQIFPIEGAVLLSGCDFRNKLSHEKLHKVLEGRRVDVVLSDMAPNATGIKEMDHDAIVSLAYEFIRFTLKVNKINGSMLLKLWDGGRLSKLEADLKQFYSSVKRVKPPASRSDSSEIFILAQDFKGVRATD